MIFALLFLSLAPPYLLSNADSLIVSHWTVDEGLPGNSMNRIIQNLDGFLWMTSYYGLIRFDGVEFQTLDQSNTPEILNNRLNLFHKSPDGRLWISLEQMGLIRTDSTGFKRYDSKNGLTNEHITVVHTLPDSRLMVGSYDGLFILDPSSERFRQVDLGVDGQRNHVTSIVNTSDGQVWATTFNGYVSLRGDRAEVYGSGLVVGIVEDSRGRVWIGLKSGLWQLNPDGSLSQPFSISAINRPAGITSIHRVGGNLLVSVQGASYVLEGERFVRVGGVAIPEDDQIALVFEDSHDVTWIITQNGIPLVFRNGRFIAVPALDPLSKASVIDVYEDSEMNLWFTSRYGGLFRVKRNPIHHIGKPEGLRGDNILGLFIDRRNRLFVGTRDDGFSMVENGKVSNFPRNASRRYGTVYSFEEDEKGHIWVGTSPHGLIRLNEADQSLVTHRLGSGILDNDVRAIHAPGNGFLWLATSSGLVHFNTETLTYDRFDRSTGLPSQSLKNIVVDASGRMWISTSDNGLFRYDPVNNDIFHFNSNNGLPSDHIRSVMIDPDDENVLWIGSETHGLIRFSEGTFRSVSVEDGLPDRVIHSIRQGPFGWIWIATNAGVVRIDKKGLNAYFDGTTNGFHFIMYDEDEGMRNFEANGGFRGGSLINKEESHILVSTQSGISVFPLNKPDPNRKPPPVFIMDGTRHSRNLRWVLTEGKHDIEVQYAGLRYTSPIGVRYQYRLLGKTEEWTDDFDRDPVYFSNLSPGEYRFEVISWNEAGTLSSDPAVLTIIVKPTLWQMGWFWVFVSLLLGGSVWTLIHMRTKNLKSIRERLEVLVSERTQDLRREKAEVEKQKAIIEEQAAHLEDLIQTREKFFAIIGHDLRGPFQTLLGLSQLMLDEYEEMDDLEIRQSLKHLRSSSENLHRLVENLLEWSTLQKGKMNTHIEPLDINALAESTVRMFGPSASVKGIHLEAIVPNSMVVNADASIVETIIRNMVSNGIKFTKTEGIVVLEAGQNETEWWIQVSDNGIGMTDVMRKSVLNIDKSVKRQGTMNEWGTGLGLALCNELIKVHGGDIIVESEPNIGSRFTAKFNNRS